MRGCASSAATRGHVSFEFPDNAACREGQSADRDDPVRPSGQWFGQRDAGLRGAVDNLFERGEEGSPVLRLDRCEPGSGEIAPATWDRSGSEVGQELGPSGSGVGGSSAVQMCEKCWIQLRETDQCG